MYVFMSAFLVVYTVATRQKVTVSWRGAWKYLILIGACEILAYVGVSWGYGATSRTSIVALVSGAFSLPTIVLARIFLKERTGWLQALASGLIVAGIALLNSA
jgi:drug/metabolite transporter (DMT)-like permease